jgi:hypothetical protein
MQSMLKVAGQKPVEHSKPQIKKQAEMDVLKILAENPSEARNPTWLLNLLTKKITHLGEQLNMTFENGLSLESDVLKRVDNFRSMDEDLKLPS